MEDINIDNEQRSSSIKLMDPNGFKVIHESDTMLDLRLHHINSVKTMRRKGIVSISERYDYDKAIKMTKNFANSDKFPQKDQEMIAEAVSESNVKDKINRLRKGDKKVEEYVGEKGMYADDYKTELKSKIIALLKLPSDAKVHLVFGPDFICQLSQGGRGPVAHCSSEGVHNEDLLYWYAVNKEANSLKDTGKPEANNIGLVDMGNNRYDIWVTAGLLRSGFTEQVFESFFTLKEKQ